MCFSWSTRSCSQCLETPSLFHLFGVVRSSLQDDTFMCSRSERTYATYFDTRTRRKRNLILRPSLRVSPSRANQRKHDRLPRSSRYRRQCSPRKLRLSHLPSLQVSPRHTQPARNRKTFQSAMIIRFRHHHRFLRQTRQNHEAAPGQCREKTLRLSLNREVSPAPPHRQLFR